MPDSGGQYDSAQCPSRDCGSYAQIVVSLTTLQLIISVIAVIFILRNQTQGIHAHQHSGLPDGATSTPEQQGRIDMDDDATMPKECAHTISLDRIIRAQTSC